MASTGRLDPSPAAQQALSPRLRQILDLLLQGHAPKQMARKLNLSVHTVREHIQRLYARFGVGGRDELMAKFIR